MTTETIDPPRTAADWVARFAVGVYVLISGTVLMVLAGDGVFSKPGLLFLGIAFVVLVVALCAGRGWAWFPVVVLNAATILWIGIFAPFLALLGGDVAHTVGLFLATLVAFLVLVSPPVQRYVSRARPTPGR